MYTVIRLYTRPMFCKIVTKSAVNGMVRVQLCKETAFLEFVMELLSSNVVGGHLDLLQTFLHSQVQLGT